MNTLIVFICKLLDCAFSTMKNILLYKNKHLFSAIVCTISTYFYLTMMVQLTKDSSELAKVVICLATFLGTYIPSKFFHVLEKEKLYIYDITTCDFKSGQKFADNIRKLNLPIKTYVAYTTNKKDVNELKKIQIGRAHV